MRASGKYRRCIFGHVLGEGDRHKRTFTVADGERETYITLTRFTFGATTAAYSRIDDLNLGSRRPSDNANTASSALSGFAGGGAGTPGGGIGGMGGGDGGG